VSNFVNPTTEYDSTRRFSKRVADYVRYRPRYPQQVIDILVAEAGLTSKSIIADIGSGTGFSTELFLKHGCLSYGVEPNTDMREAGAEYLEQYPNFISINGSAEKTTLPKGAVNFVTAGQALHWFNPPAALSEFNRILKPGGKLAFFWNERDPSPSDFMSEYMTIVEAYILEERTAHHSDVGSERLAYLFADGAYAEHHIPWTQSTNLEQLIGRAVSSSYMPTRDDPRAEAMISDLTALFNRHASDGQVNFHYVTDLFFGSPARGDA